MKLKLSALLIMLILLLSATPVSAWDYATHEWIAGRVCELTRCPCPDEILQASIIPDSVFRDSGSKHFCYDPKAVFSCEPSEYYECPEKVNCPALEKTAEWFLQSVEPGISECESWSRIGIASHYLSDSTVFWHRVRKESSWCHSNFERKVGEAVNSCGLFCRFREWLGFDGWKVCECGACVTKNDLERIAESVAGTAAEISLMRANMK